MWIRKREVSDPRFVPPTGPSRLSVEPVNRHERGSERCRPMAHHILGHQRLHANFVPFEHSEPLRQYHRDDDLNPNPLSRELSILAPCAYLLQSAASSGHFGASASDSRDPDNRVVAATTRDIPKISVAQRFQVTVPVHLRPVRSIH